MWSSLCGFCFFKQKTAYEMRISDWSSDVCSSDLFVGERRIAKPGDMLPADAAIALRGQDHPWVSRGGVKLAHALDHFAIDPAGQIGRASSRERVCQYG